MIGQLENLFSFNNGLFDRKGIRKILEEISEIAGYLWQRGWAERNAGNFSVNITNLIPDKDLDTLAQYPFLPLPREFPALVDQLFLVSRTGSRMRDMSRDPEAGCCLIFISRTGSAYHIISEEEDGEVKPTSELATHLGVQQLLIHQGGAEKVVLHTHPLELIALTQISQCSGKINLNRILHGMHPETMTFLPEGVGFIPYQLPGTERIAQATIQEFENHHVVIWEKHGCMAIAPDLSEAFDRIDILAKAARIYLYVKSSGQEPSGLSSSELKELKNYSSGC